MHVVHNMVWERPWEGTEEIGIWVWSKRQVFARQVEETIDILQTSWIVAIHKKVQCYYCIYHLEQTTSSWFNHFQKIYSKTENVAFLGISKVC